jgi:hypothetical protein
MRPAAVRLALVTGLFLAWLGYLGYLVAKRPRTAEGWPLVVSHPQVLTSEIDIVADIDDPRGEVVVEEVLYPEGAALKKGDRIKVDFLEQCRPMPRRADEVPPKDFSGPGKYLVPMRQAGQGRYEVAPIPPSPGFGGTLNPVRIYPATAEALAQYRRAPKAE